MKPKRTEKNRDGCCELSLGHIEVLHDAIDTSGS